MKNPGSSPGAPTMNKKWGGKLTKNGDGTWHATLWRAGDRAGDKGDRLSWEHHPDGRVEGCHYTDQNRRWHSSDPADWRAPVIFTVIATIAVICLLIC